MPEFKWWHRALIHDLGLDPAGAAQSADAVVRRDKCGLLAERVCHLAACNPQLRGGHQLRDQQDNPASLLNNCRRLLDVRRNTPALLTGEYLPLLPESEECFAFIRHISAQAVLVVLNYSEGRHALDLGTRDFRQARVLFSSAGRARTFEPLASLSIGAFEVLIAEMLE